MQKTQTATNEARRPKVIWFAVAVALGIAVVAGGYERSRLQPNPNWITINAPNPPHVTALP